MKLNFFTKLIFLITLFTLCNEANSNINNKILVKIGNEIVTGIDLENEIKIILTLENLKINQQNINAVKPKALKSLISLSVKQSEIDKYQVKEYNKLDLNNYIKETEKRLNTNNQGLRNIFKRIGIDYDHYKDRFKIELLWNTLIFQIYKNQININMVEINNELDNRKNKKLIVTEYNLSEIEIPRTKDLKATFKEIYKSIKERGFEKTAKKFSSSVSSTNGGLIGWLNTKSLIKSYAIELADTKKGDVTRPIEIQGYYIILKINDVKNIEKNVDINKVKKDIIEQKKENKLNLFSRSHYSNIYNSTLIQYNE